MTAAITTPLLVLGAGSWGTALAMQSARMGHATRLWGIDVSQWATPHCNDLYLPEHPLPEALEVTDDLAQACAGVNHFLMAVPSHVFADVLHQLKPLLPADAKLAWGTKGFDLKRGVLLEQLVVDILGDAVPRAALSGPSFAKEVAQGLPTSVALGCTDDAFQKSFSAYMCGPQFAMHATHDTIGVAVGGAVKNVMAIAVGLCDGLKLGANARCALMTRGLDEMARLGVAMGADHNTFMGLSGMGDLVLTCSDDQSRNRRFGLALAAGVDAATAEAQMGQVVEGQKAVVATRALAEKHGVHMPIAEMVYRMVHEGAAPEAALRGLLASS